LPFDVDFKVMGTFTEFYIALLKFVNFKLFTDLGLPYPVQQPMLADQSYLDAQSVESLQKVARAKFEAAEEKVVDEEFEDTPEMRALNERVERSRKQKKLFANCVFLLHREVPIYILQYLILSFGGTYYLRDQMDDLSESEAAKLFKKVTHVVMDRPLPAE
jgi:pescadillo protein